MIPPKFVEQMLKERPKPIFAHGGELEPLRWELNLYKENMPDVITDFAKALEHIKDNAVIPPAKLSRKELREIMHKAKGVEKSR